jgi:hypothetical protein
MALARDIVAGQLGKPLMQRMEEYYNAQPVLPQPIAQAAQQQANYTPVGDVVRPSAPVGGTPTQQVVIPPQQRQEASHGLLGGIASAVTKPLRSTYDAAAQLAGVKNQKQTALQGGAYQTAPQQAARLGYAGSGAQDILNWMNNPNAKNTALAAMAIPLPVKEIPLGGGRLLERVALGEEAGRRSVSRTVLARQLMERGLSKKEAVKAARNEHGIPIQYVLKDEAGSKLGQVTYLLKPDEVHLSTMTAHPLAPANPQNAMDLARMPLASLEDGLRQLTGTVAWKGGPERMQKVLDQISRRMGLGPIRFTPNK